MKAVPEQWIPFIPVRVPGSVREVQLQRASLLRTLAGDPNPPEKIRPRTTLLREHLPASYFLFEDEVPRAGVAILPADTPRQRRGHHLVGSTKRNGARRGEERTEVRYGHHSAGRSAVRPAFNGAADSNPTIHSCFQREIASCRL